MNGLKVFAPILSKFYKDNKPYVVPLLAAFVTFVLSWTFVIAGAAMNTTIDGGVFSAIKAVASTPIGKFLWMLFGVSFATFVTFVVTDLLYKRVYVAEFLKAAKETEPEEASSTDE